MNILTEVIEIELYNVIFKSITEVSGMNNEKIHKAFRERMENWDWSKIKG